MVLPRRYLPLAGTARSLSLHVFADASIKAYGAVAYLCESRQSSLVMTSTRVSPLKPKTLPNLELMAAVVAARLAKFIQSTLFPLRSDIPTYLWSDSQIVLHWLHSHKMLKQFIASRVKEITKLFPPVTWRYCPTTDNPADLLTRGISATSLETSTLWKYSPTWLTNNTKWPVWNHTEVLQLQVNTTDNKAQDVTENKVTQTLGLYHIITVSNYNNLDKLLAVTAYTFRFITNTKQTAVKHTGPLSTQELNKATLAWIRDCQQQTFFREIDNLTSKSSNRLPLVR